MAQANAEREPAAHRGAEHRGLQRFTRRAEEDGHPVCRRSVRHRRERTVHAPLCARGAGQRREAAEDGQGDGHAGRGARCRGDQHGDDQ